MALIPLTSPFSMNAALLTIAADDFTAAVSQVQLDPSTSTSTWRGIGGNVRKAQAPSEWSCSLGLAQDLAPGGLTRYLLDHDGETVAAILTPVLAGPTISVSLVLAAATLGGTAGPDLAVATVTLAVDGKPIIDDGI